MPRLLDSFLNLFRRENGHAPESAQERARDIDVHELHRLLKEPVAPLLLDVREPVEKRAADLGGRNVPLWSLPQSLDDLHAWAERPVVVYCRSGARSGQAVRLMRAHGIENVHNLKGGLIAWTRHYGTPVPADGPTRSAG